MIGIVDGIKMVGSLVASFGVDPYVKAGVKILKDKAPEFFTDAMQTKLGQFVIEKSIDAAVGMVVYKTVDEVAEAVTEIKDAITNKDEDEDPEEESDE